MKINELVAKQRRSLGYSSVEVAKQIGISKHSFNDVEMHEDEFTSALKLSEAKTLAAFLEFDLGEALELGSEKLSNTHQRSELIRDRMRLGRITPKVLASRLGFDEAAIEAMVIAPNFLESWPIDLVMELAALLKVDPRLLLAIGPDS